jgi:GPH family glycoside/pentoside/hexuronide:cation symporter
MAEQETAKRSLAKTGIFYSLIRIGDSIIWEIIASWQNYFYFPPDGVALIPVGFLYGLLMTAHAAISIIIALPIGYWSDRTRTRWGRRLPYMFIAGLPRLVFFVLLWTPPNQTKSTFNLVYLTLIMVGHSMTSAFQQVPSEALFPELGKTDQERVKLSAWAGLLQPLGLIATSFAGVAIEHLGYLNTALIYATFVLPLFYLPFFVLRERPNAHHKPKEQLSMRESFRLIGQNRPFLIFTAVNTLSMSGGVLVRSMFPFIVTELLLLTQSDTVYFYIAGLSMMLASYPVATRLSKRWGKRRVFSIAMLGSAFIMPMLIFFGDWIPIPLIIPGVAWAALLALTTGAAGVFETAFMGEIIEHDAQLTGQRREGAYYAALDLVDRILYSAIGLLPPVLLILGRGEAGPHGTLGIQLAGLLGGLMTLAAVFLFRYYRVPDTSVETSSTSQES